MVNLKTYQCLLDYSMSNMCYIGKIESQIHRHKSGVHGGQKDRHGSGLHECQKGRQEPGLLEGQKGRYDWFTTAKKR